MKDLYSFDRDEEGLSHSYQAMYDAYGRVFSRCGLKALPVEADSGAIGGDTTHEFMVLASSGEALIVNCELCDYAANVERAECVVLKQEEALWEDVTELATPNVTTIADLATFTAWQPDRFIKTMIYVADEKPIAAVIRGDHSLNEVKLQKALGCTTLAMADAQTIESVTGSPPGYAGPVGLTIPIVADSSVVEVTNGIAGANKSDTHLTNVNYGRDYKATQISDIRQAAAGDACPRCQGRMLEDRGIEVGQVFKLGTKYSESLKASYLDESGRDHPIVMGCYGIGVSRTVAAVIEQHHDQDGICWPAAIAPYHVVIIPVSYKSESQRQTAHDLYEELQSGGYQVLLDDRNERPGVKFKDADLIGFPVRIVVGDRNLKNGQVEVINRRTKDKLLVVLSDVAPTCATLLRTNAKTT